MARINTKSKSATFILFNVTYEDGTITSNRRVSTDLLDLSYGDALLDLAGSAIKEQDNEISQQSKQQRAKIKSIVRA
jgi:hypothetical protein